MQKTTTALATPLREQLDRLSAFEPSDLPVVSLYLDMRVNQNGRVNYDSFLRKALPERAATLKGEARKSFNRDAERIRQYLETERRTSAQALAIFACSARGDFFEAVQLDVPIEEHQLFIGSVPHIYPLARLNDQYPRYAALLVNTNAASLFVFGLGATQRSRQVTNVKTRKTSVGGWSQARYQRHTENFHLLHMKEVVSLLERVVADEQINHIVVACDETSKPLLMEQLPKHLSEKVIEVIALDMKVAPEHQVLAESLEALRRNDRKTDAEHVEAMFDAWHAGGLAVAGPAETMRALEMRLVEELLITAKPDTLRSDKGVDPKQLADTLVTMAQKNSSRIRFIEDTELLSDVGGVGALLRFTI